MIFFVKKFKRFNNRNLRTLYVHYKKRFLKISRLFYVFHIYFDLITIHRYNVALKILICKGNERSFVSFRFVSFHFQSWTEKHENEYACIHRNVTD